MAKAPSCIGMPTPALSKNVVVATHGHCFDGLCSAVMFTRLYRHLEPATARRFTTRAAGYGPGQNGVDPKVLAGDVNAILDFRFSAAPKLDWYFDHHVSAFAGAGRARGLRGGAPSEQRGPSGASSTTARTARATKLIADVGAARFGLDPAPDRASSSAGPT